MDVTVVDIPKNVYQFGVRKWPQHMHWCKINSIPVTLLDTAWYGMYPGEVGSQLRLCVQFIVYDQSELIMQL